MEAVELARAERKARERDGKRKRGARKTVAASSSCAVRLPRPLARERLGVEMGRQQQTTARRGSGRRREAAHVIGILL